MYDLPSVAKKAKEKKNKNAKTRWNLSMYTMDSGKRQMSDNQVSP